MFTITITMCFTIINSEYHRYYESRARASGPAITIILLVLPLLLLQ